MRLEQEWKENSRQKKAQVQAGAAQQTFKRTETSAFEITP